MALEREFAGLYRRLGAVDPTREAATGNAASGVLFDPLGAPSDGAAGIRSVIRWFVGSGIDNTVWDHSVFSKNRDRLLEVDDIAAKFFAVVLAQPTVNKLLSSDHFSVDGTLIG